LELAFLVDSWPELDVEIEAWDRKTGLKVAAFEVPEGAKIFEACPSFLPPASVRVALADADSGKLLKGQVIRIFEGLARGAERIPESFKVVQWPPGEYEITAFADGYKPETIPVRVVSGEVRDLGTIRLRRKDK
jgi:hypothetical protein